jgi:hypothetical protein
MDSLKELQGTPLSFLSNALIPIFEASTILDSNTGDKKINFGKMKQMIGKQVLNWFPDWMRGFAAEVFGIDDDVKQSQQPPANTQPLQQPPVNSQPQNETTNKQEQQNQTETFNEIPQKFTPINDKIDESKKEKPKTRAEAAALRDSKPIHMEDGLLESTEPIQMKLGNTTYETAPNDSVLAFKSGGVLDLALKDITKAITDINTNINSLNRNILMISSENKNTPSIVNVNNSTVSSDSNNTKEYLFESPRDSIFNERTKWWNITDKRSAVV